MLRRLLTASAALLALFHVWLFAGQLWDGALAAEAGLLFRWVAAAALVAGLVALRRSGASPVHGRKSGAIWLIALLLHGPAIANRLDVADVLDARAIPDIVLTIVTVIGAAGVAVGLAGAGVASRRPFAVRPLALATAGPATFAGLDPGAFVRFSPRPPPPA